MVNHNEHEQHEHNQRKHDKRGTIRSGGAQRSVGEKGGEWTGTGSLKSESEHDIEAVGGVFLDLCVAFRWKWASEWAI